MIDFTKTTPDEREALLGREFRNVLVLEAGAGADGSLLTRVLFDGQAVTLVGNPSDALRTYLAGRAADGASA